MTIPLLGFTGGGGIDLSARVQCTLLIFISFIHSYFHFKSHSISLALMNSPILNLIIYEKNVFVKKTSWLLGCQRNRRREKPTASSSVFSLSMSRLPFAPPHIFIIIITMLSTPWTTNSNEFLHPGWWDFFLLISLISPLLYTFPHSSPTNEKQWDPHPSFQVVSQSLLHSLFTPFSFFPECVGISLLQHVVK